MTVIAKVKSAAHDGWAQILSSVGVDVPPAGKHGACPVCGGTDRFHFINDHGGGEWHCRQCDAPNHGDGLDLICRVKGVGVLDAAKLVADVLGIDTRASISSSNQGAKPEVERRQSVDASANKKRQQFNQRYKTANNRTVQAESDYLKAKGLTGFTFPVLPDGSLLLPLVDGDGVITGAQRITPAGEKRLLADSVMKGSFISVGTPPAAPEVVIIAEGIATALSAGLMCTGYVVAAINAGNLSHVAKVMRQRYPQAKIIIAADNDWHLPGELDDKGQPKKNTGKLAADAAAKCVSGWVALPPTDYKTDWDDYRQNNGLEAAAKAFASAMNQSQGEPETIQFSATGGGKNVSSNAEVYSALGDGEALTPDELRSLEAINRVYTHVTIGGKHKVVSLKPCQVNGETHAFEDLAQFRNYFHHTSKVAKRSAGSAWLSWPGKNYKPGGVGFYPAISKCPPDVFNLFSGFSVEPVEGDCSPYMQHLKDVICAGESEAYHYLVGWMAHLIQKPDEKPSVAIVMKSVPGTGKGTTVRPLLEMLGQYAAHINGAGQIAGRFNSTLANKLLVFADEVTVRNRVEADRLKGIISETSVNLERKGIDAEPMPNFARLIFASNSAQTLVAGVGERRYLVLEPDPALAQVKNYFDHLHLWANNNGAGKLLYLLQQYDLSGFDRHRAPQTSALRGEILQGLSGVNLFLYTEIMKDRPFDGVARIAVSGLIDKFLVWSQERGDPRQAAAARSMIGKAMVALKLKGFGRRGRGDGVTYELPDSETLREAFAQMIGMGGYDVF